MTTDSGETVAPPGPATLDAVRRHLRMTTNADDDLIQDAVDAANMFVWRLPARNYPYAAPTAEDMWAADQTQGAVMLAARLYRRRNSPAGVESFSDLGGAVYVQRNDPDIALLLGIGAYARPRTG